MSHSSQDPIRNRLEAIYRSDSRRVYASLVRILCDFDLAEEVLHEAFATALVQWPGEGVPANPYAWLVSCGRFKAIDALRRRSRVRTSIEDVSERAVAFDSAIERADHEIADDQLRLIFTCCHPALNHSAQVALTLREVCGLTTEEIASAFLTSPTTIAQRIVRGKTKIRDAKIPFAVPSESEFPERLDAVLSTIYLVFNEGYAASSGPAMIRADLASEAIRLGRMLVELLNDTECFGLLSLMLFHDSRKSARIDTNGDLILLEQQDRSLWNQDAISEAERLLDRAYSTGIVGSYCLQAAIAGEHAKARSAVETDWRRIVALYDLLQTANPSPIVELNRAVAVAMCEGAQAGIELVSELIRRGELTEYHLAHAALAELYRRSGNLELAIASYGHALQLAKQDPERRFLEGRIRSLSVNDDH